MTIVFRKNNVSLSTRYDKIVNEVLKTRLFFRIFALCKREVTPSQQKKETSFFVLRSTFRIFAQTNNL